MLLVRCQLFLVFFVGSKVAVYFRAIASRVPIIALMPQAVHYNAILFN